jgi:hypothetical protein
MTEDESIKLSESGTDFCRALAKMTATIVAKFPEAIEDDVICYLQDQTSLYSPFTADRIRAEIKRLRTFAP